MTTKHRRGSLTGARAQIKDRIVNQGNKGPFIIGHWTHGGMNEYEVRPAAKPWVDHGYSVNGINRWYVDEVWHGVSGRGARMRAEKLWDVTKNREVKKNPARRRNPEGWSKIPTSFAGITSFDYFVEVDPAYYNEIAVESGGKAWLNKATQDEIVRRGFYGVPATRATIAAFNRGDHYKPPEYALVYSGMDGTEITEYKTKAELIKAIQDRALHCYPASAKGFRDPEVGSYYEIVGTNLREAGMTVSDGTLRLADETKRNPTVKARRKRAARQAREMLLRESKFIRHYQRGAARPLELAKHRKTRRVRSFKPLIDDGVYISRSKTVGPFFVTQNDGRVLVVIFGYTARDAEPGIKGKSASRNYKTIAAAKSAYGRLTSKSACERFITHNRTPGVKKNPASKTGHTNRWIMDDGLVVTSAQLKRKFRGKLPSPAHRRLLGIRKVAKRSTR